MFLSDDSFDLGLLGNIMFKFLPSMFPKSILYIEKAVLHALLKRHQLVQEYSP